MGKKPERFAGTAMVGEKGQIVIPKQVRDMFGIKSGDLLLILADEQRGIAIPPREKADSVLGRLMEFEDSGT